jgi:transcriptional regulator of acetoin/glycerol metabolism
MVEATVALGEAPSLIEAASMRPRDGEFSPELLAMTYKEARAHALEQFERAYVAKVLQRASGNATQAARMAAMDRSYLFDLMKRHRIRARSVDPE